MVSLPAYGQDAENAEKLREFGLDDHVIALALKKCPSDLNQALDFCLSYVAPADQGARSISGAPNFQSVESSSSQAGKEVVRFQESSMPKNPPPSPLREDEPPPLIASDTTLVPPQREVIDVDKWPGADEDEDAMQRAIAASMEDTGSAQMQQVMAESMRAAAREKWQTDPLQGPASKRRRLEPETRVIFTTTELHRSPGKIRPVILQPTDPAFAWLPPVLHAFYANPPFRQTLVGIPVTQPNHPSGISGFEGFWNGRLVFPPLTEDAKCTAQDLMAALQRLFIVMQHTTRNAVSTADIEAAAGLDASRIGEAVECMCEFARNVCDAWIVVIDELGKTAVEAGTMTMEEAQDICVRRKRVLAHFGGSYKADSMERCGQAEDFSLFSLDATPQSPNEPEETALWRALEARLHRDSGLQGEPFLEDFAQSCVFYIRRPRPFNVNYGDRRPFDYPNELYLDRYALIQADRVRSKRRRVREMEGVRAEMIRKRSLLIDPKKRLALDGSIEYLTKIARSDDPERARQQAVLRDHFTNAREKINGRVKDYDKSIGDLDAEAQGLFDTDDMHQVGPYLPVAVVFSNGLNRFHTYTIDRINERVWKAMPTDSFEVEPKDVAQDETGIHTGDGLVMLIYAANYVDVSISDVPNELMISAIEKDNQDFEAELSADMDADLPMMPIEAVKPDRTPVGMLSSAVGDIVVPSAVDSDAEMTGEVDGLRGGAASLVDDDSDGDEEMAANGGVQLGFAEAMPRRGGLHVTTMTGKIGGLPIWLDSSRPLPVESSTCLLCTRAMRFLLQINAPDDDNPAAFFRMLYVFACESAACITKDASKSVRAFRHQLPEHASCMEDSSRLAKGVSAVHLNDKSHALYKESELVSEPEPSSISMSSSPVTAPRLSAAEGPDANEPDTQVGVDGAFLRFQFRLSAEPEQILRYYFGDPLPEPLWISDQGKPNVSKLPTCALCGHNRQCELQILPTLIPHLGIEDETQSDSFDFGTLLIYTCSQRCSIPDTGWAEEVCFGQAISNEGMSLQGWKD